MIQSIRLILGLVTIFLFVGCGGSSSLNGSSSDITKINKRNISGKTFNIKDVSSSHNFITTFNSDGTITDGGSKFSSDFGWEVSKTGELQTLYKLLGMTLSITTHKQTAYEDECYIVSSTETNSQWKGEYKICKPIETPIFTGSHQLNEDSLRVGIEGKVGTRVFVNGIDTDNIIDSNGQAQVIIDTTGLKDGSPLSIVLKDDERNQSDILYLEFRKDDGSEE
jgi:hypothetical protein